MAMKTRRYVQEKVSILQCSESKQFLSKSQIQFFRIFKLFKIVHFQDCLTFEYCTVGSKTLWFFFFFFWMRSPNKFEVISKAWILRNFVKTMYVSIQFTAKKLTYYSSHSVKFADFTLLSHKNVFRQINYLVTYLYLVKQLFSRNFCNYHTLCFHHFFTKISWNQCIQYHSGKKAPKISLIWRKNDWFFRRNRDRVF